MTTAALPVRVRNTIDHIRHDPQLNEGIRAMRARKREFPRTDMATLAGIAMIPEARRMLENALEEQFTKVAFPAGSYVPEVIVGGGLHAAAYATARHQSGFSKPWVIEQNRVGGVFAMTRNPAFYLNSRNRPGRPSLPGERQGLNVLPGAPLQPSYLANGEFQNNTDFAYCIRLALAAHALTWAGITIELIERDGEFYRVTTSAGDVHAGRVIEARGLGISRVRGTRGDRILTFDTFMKKIDTDKFPLRGMRRVAVVGNGDSAKCAIEALTGQGPCEHMSINALDYVEQIDWYGEKLPPTCSVAITRFRSRYRRLAALLPIEDGREARLQPYRRRVAPVPGFDCAYINDRAYDAVIMCTGYYTPPGPPTIAYYSGPLVLAAKVPDEPRYIIGAQKPPEFESDETRTVRAIKANRIAAFRLVPRTYTLAATLPTR